MDYNYTFMYYENTWGGFKNTDKQYIVTVKCLLT